MKKAKEELQKIGFYVKFSVVNTVNVWSDGKTMRRYQGQDEDSPTYHFALQNA